MMMVSCNIDNNNNKTIQVPKRASTQNSSMTKEESKDEAERVDEEDVKQPMEKMNEKRRVQKVHNRLRSRKDDYDIHFVYNYKNTNNQPNTRDGNNDFISDRRKLLIEKDQLVHLRLRIQKDKEQKVMLLEPPANSTKDEKSATTTLAESHTNSSEYSTMETNTVITRNEASSKPNTRNHEQVSELDKLLEHIERRIQHCEEAMEEQIRHKRDLHVEKIKKKGEQSTLVAVNDVELMLMIQHIWSDSPLECDEFIDYLENFNLLDGNDCVDISNLEDSFIELNLSKRRDDPVFIENVLSISLSQPLRRNLTMLYSSAE